MSDDSDPLAWWTISGRDLLEALRRCQSGESADLVYAELYANSSHEHPAEDDQ